MRALAAAAALLAASASLARAGVTADVEAHATVDAAVDATAAPDLAVAAEVAVAVEVAVDVRGAPPPEAPVAAATADAAWTTHDTGDPGFFGPTPLTRSHWEAGLAIAIAETDAPGFHAAFGRQVGAFRIAAEYTHTAAPSHTADRFALPASGRRQRLGAAVRYRIDLGTPTVGSGLYVEAGGGLTRDRWDDGASATGRDLMAGLGVEVLGGERRLVGLDLGARILGAEVDTPAEPRALSLLFTVGLLFGQEPASR